MPDEASAMLFKNDAPWPRFVEQGKSADNTAAGSSKTRKPSILGKRSCRSDKSQALYGTELMMVF